MVDLNKWFVNNETEELIEYVYKGLLVPLADTKFKLISSMELRGHKLINVSNCGCTYLFRKKRLTNN